MTAEHTEARRFAGRVALVNGGSSGIGLAIVERLLHEGAKVAILAAPQDAGDLDGVLRRLETEGRSIAGMTGDISKEGDARDFVAMAVEKLGAIDAVFNNAGGGGGRRPAFADGSVERLDRTLAVNIRGPFLCIQEAVLHMSAGGSIVNTASTGSFMGEEFETNYNAAKAGLAGLTRALAVDLAPRGIRVNAVAPGWVATRNTVHELGDPNEWAKNRTHIPLDRPARPSEIAAVCAFLASDEASYVTGALYLCDGGMTAGFRSSGWQAVVPDEPS